MREKERARQRERERERDRESEKEQEREKRESQSESERRERAREERERERQRARARGRDLWHMLREGAVRVLSDHHGWRPGKRRRPRAARAAKKMVHLCRSITHRNKGTRAQASATGC